MKKKYTKLAASVSIALTQSINADVDTENVNSKISSSEGGVIIANPLGNAKPKLTTSYPPAQKCPDSKLSARKNVVRQVQYYLIMKGYLNITDIASSLGVIDSDTRKAVKSFQSQNGIKSVSGTTLDNYTLNAMGISCN